MLNIFNEVNTLDEKCYKKYFLSEDILMEHAALSMFNFINKKFKDKKTIIIVCGSGNNGADGIVLARLLYKIYDVKIFIASKAKSNIAKLQEKRTLSLTIEQLENLDNIKSCDILVDCLFGSGLNRVLNEKYTNIINQINNIKAYKIACDIPSGINIQGQILLKAVKCDTTITMGALKLCLYSDIAKDYVGNIIKANLGVHESLYENDTNIYLLEKEDLNLPLRDNKNTNKGSFGYLSVFVGEKMGAGIIACETALAFGAGLVCAITKKEDLPFSIMYSKTIDKKTSAIAIGMGLGKNFNEDIFKIELPMLLDADVFYNENILKLLNKNNIVLTPHPKEFCSLLKICNIANINITQLQNNRFKYVNEFCLKYPNIVLLLKGANVIIAKQDITYINPLGTASLSFAGSGDVLAGLISSLLAQGYDSLNACIQGSLAHTIAANDFKGNNYSLNPEDLINQIKIL